MSPSDPEAATVSRLRAELGAVDSAASQRLRAGLLARAEDELLLDIAYATVDTPVGPYLLAATEAGLVRLCLRSDLFETTLAELSEQISPRIFEAPSRLEAARRQVVEYFEGRRRDFELPLDWRLSHGFGLQVRRALLEVGFGETASYLELAEMSGRPRAARAVGTAMARNPIPLIVPCHRVVRSDGSIGEYGGRPEMKEFLLRHEGALPAGRDRVGC